MGKWKAWFEDDGEEGAMVFDEAERGWTLDSAWVAELLCENADNNGRFVGYPDVDIVIVKAPDGTMERLEATIDWSPCYSFYQVPDSKPSEVDGGA